MKIDWEAAYKEFDANKDTLPLRDLDLICAGLSEYHKNHPTLAPGMWISPNRVVAMVCAKILADYERDADERSTYDVSSPSRP